MPGGRMILNTPRYKGEFPLDIVEEPLTGIEWRWVKQVSGYTLGTFMEGLETVDPTLLCAFAAVALVRNGRIGEQDVLPAADELLHVPFDGERIVFDAGATEEEEQQSPPATAPASEPRLASTGASSSSTSGLSEPLPSLIGALD